MYFGTVQFRYNNGTLEYRCLVIIEKESISCGDKLVVDWKRPYSEWQPLPQITPVNAPECPTTHSN